MKVEYKVLWINEEKEVSYSLVNQAFIDGRISDVIFILHLIFSNDAVINAVNIIHVINAVKN